MAKPAGGPKPKAGGNRDDDWWSSNIQEILSFSDNKYSIEYTTSRLLRISDA